MFSKRDDASVHVRLRTREDRATNTFTVRATYEPFGLSTPTRGNAVFVKCFRCVNAGDEPRPRKRQRLAS